MPDPTTRYYAETPCRACDGVGEIDWDDSNASQPDAFGSNPCPDCDGSGGFRVLLIGREVDYEAAMRQWAHEPSWVDAAQRIRAIVDAALGGSEVLLLETDRD